MLGRLVSGMLPDLPSEVWWVIGVNTAMSVIFNFVSIFVNLYWWNQGHSIFLVSLFNLASTVTLFISYYVGSYFLYRRDIRFVMLLSTLFAGATFVGLFLYLPEYRTIFTILIGLMFGCTQGFFWSANNSSMYTFLKAEQYADYFSVNTVVAQVIAVVIPLASAGILYGVGFHLSFVVMLLFVIAAFFVSMRIPHQGLSESIFDHMHHREVFSKPGTSWVMFVVLCAGLVNQFLLLFSMIYIFSFSNNVGIVAVFNIGYSLVLLGGLTLYRRWKGLSQNVWLIIGSACVLVSYILAFLTPRDALSVVVVLLMRLGGLYVSGASGRQRYRIIMQGDVVWRTRFGLWMEVPFAVSRTIILMGALFVRHLGDTAFLGITLISGLALLGLPILTQLAIKRYEAFYNPSAGATD